MKELLTSRELNEIADEAFDLARQAEENGDLDKAKYETERALSLRSEAEEVRRHELADERDEENYCED